MFTGTSPNVLAGDSRTSWIRFGSPSGRESDRARFRHGCPTNFERICRAYSSPTENIWSPNCAELSRRLTENSGSRALIVDRRACVRISTGLAPEEGFEPPTRRLTAACSTTELLRNIGIRPREFSTHPRRGQRARGPLRPRDRNEERGLAISLMRTRCWSTSALLRASRFHGRTDDRAAKRSYHRRVTGRGASGRRRVDFVREHGPERGRIQSKAVNLALFSSRPVVPNAKTTFFEETDLLGSPRRRDRGFGRAPGLPNSKNPGQ